MVERYFEVTWGTCAEYYLTLATDKVKAWEKVAEQLGIDSTAYEYVVKPTTPGEFNDRLLKTFFIK